MAKIKLHILDKIIGANIKWAREQKGMSQTTLAKLFGVSFQQIQKYEYGNNRISASTLYTIAAVLGHDISWFCQRHTLSKLQTGNAKDRQARLLREAKKAKRAIVKD